ncbi:CCR4-NOT transcription complex subunit 1 [Pelomyxa schiedti]|nr:CCR4-NOT transcription complex subunit 1 [Pelomyxa schiedti]
MTDQAVGVRRSLEAKDQAVALLLALCCCSRRGGVAEEGEEEEAPRLTRDAARRIVRGWVLRTERMVSAMLERGEDWGDVRWGFVCFGVSPTLGVTVPPFLASEGTGFLVDWIDGSHFVRVGQDGGRGCGSFHVVQGGTGGTPPGREPSEGREGEREMPVDEGEWDRIGGLAWGKGSGKWVAGITSLGRIFVWRMQWGRGAAGVCRVFASDQAYPIPQFLEFTNFHTRGNSRVEPGDELTVVLARTAENGHSAGIKVFQIDLENSFRNGTLAVISEASPPMYETLNHPHTTGVLLGSMNQQIVAIEQDGLLNTSTGQLSRLPTGSVKVYAADPRHFGLFWGADDANLLTVHHVDSWNSLASSEATMNATMSLRCRFAGLSLVDGLVATRRQPQGGAEGGDSIEVIDLMTGSSILQHHLTSETILLGTKKSNFKQNLSELTCLCKLYGSDAYVHTLRVVFDQIDLKERVQKDYKIHLLRDLLSMLDTYSNYTTIVFLVFEVSVWPKLCEATSTTDTAGTSAAESGEVLCEFVRSLKLPLGCELALAVALYQLRPSTLSQQGSKLLQERLNDILSGTNGNHNHGVPETVLQAVLSFAYQHETLSKHHSELVSVLIGQQGGSSHPFSLLYPFLPEQSSRVLLEAKHETTSDVGEEVDDTDGGGMESECDLSAAVHPSVLVREIGFPCMSNVRAFRTILEHFPKPLVERDFALILTAMARYICLPQSDDSPAVLSFGTSQDEGKQTQWNLTVFADTVKEMYPKLNWTQVIRNLDHPGFYVAEHKALAVIVNAYKKCCREPFPLGYLFEDWTNKAGQLSLLKVSLTAGADLFSSTSKKQGGEKSGNSLWQSVSLIEALLHLAETENQSLVRSLFETPLKSNPELLLKGLAQVKESQL